MQTSLAGNPYGRPFEFEGSREHGILMIHGFTATPGTLYPMGKTLHETTGLFVRGILLPGHGTTVEDMAATRWHDWLRAAENAFDEMRKICKTVSVAGLSMGGTLTLLLAETKALRSAVAIAPALSVYNRKSWLAGLFWPFIRYTEETEYIPKKDFLNEYNISYKKTPVRCAADLNHLMRTAYRNLSKIHCPLLIAKAGRDETVRPEKIDRISGKTNGPVKMLTLPQSPHVCTLGPEREMLFREAAEFFQTVPEGVSV